jgi:hypothetical protein
MTIRNVLICCALALAPACHKKDPIDKMVDMMEELGGAIEDAKGDCGKMADGVESVVKKYDADLKDMKDTAEELRGDKDKAKELMEKYGARLQKVMPAMMGMMKCADDPKMKAVSEKLQGMM